jgi:hypothetical protein
MQRIEMNEVDQQIAKVCDPAAANRYHVTWHNPHTGEQWLVARVLPGDMARLKEALRGQGCEVVGYQQERSEWPLTRWLKQYHKGAPVQKVAENLVALGAPRHSVWH